MAKANNGKNKPNATAKKVTPIKVEKIEDDERNEKKEVIAIIIGILIVAALVVGSVIYFKGDEKPLVTPNDKENPDVEVVPEPEESTEEDEKEDDKVKKVSYVVYKECSSCSVVTLDEYSTEDDKNTLASNKIENKVYYTDKEDTYQLVVTGTLKNNVDDLEFLEEVSKFLAVNKASKDNKLDKKQKKELQSKYVQDTIDRGVIVVGSEDASYASHAFAVRVEEKDQIDWSKGVTVNGTTYKENEEGAFADTQDEDGVNIVVGVNEDDLGKKAKNEKVQIELKYTTKKGEKKTVNYELDLEDVEVAYEKKIQSEDTEVATKDKVEQAVEKFKQAAEEIDAAAAEIADETTEPELESAPTEPTENVTEPTEGSNTASENEEQL